MTVLGPRDPVSLGTTLVHEHLFIDLRRASFTPPPGDFATIAEAPASSLARPVLERHSCSVRDNLVLDDVDLAVAELERFAAVGGGAIVDVTPPDIGRSPELLREVSQRTGVAVVMGSGRYCEIGYRDRDLERSEKDVEEELIRELSEGADATGIRPGIIGEIGVNGEALVSRRLVGEMTVAERRTLRAASRASALTGAPMTVHMPSRAGAVSAVLDVLNEVDAPLERISLSHMDTIDDIGLHEETIDQGLWIQYDCFGMALSNNWYADPGDDLRCEWLARHRETGRLRRVLVSHDVWGKAQLRAFGGAGYDHLTTAIVPRLRELGFGDDELRQLFVSGPAEFLTWKDPG